MKNVVVTGSAFLILGIVLGIVQLWFEPWGLALFIKLELTLAALFLISLVVMVIGFARKEHKDFRHQQNGDRLDD